MCSIIGCSEQGDDLMISTPTRIDVPLRTDEHGVIRVSQTRVTLDTLLGFYKQGQSPEALHEGFPSVPLGDIYAVIAWYLVHQEAADAYLEQGDREGEEIRKKIEALPTYKPLTRAMLEARLKAQRE